MAFSVLLIGSRAARPGCGVSFHASVFNASGKSSRPIPSARMICWRAATLTFLLPWIHDETCESLSACFASEQLYAHGAMIDLPLNDAPKLLLHVFDGGPL